jgi:hypothetical protein
MPLMCTSAVLFSTNDPTDITGDESKSTKAIVDIYDIFGLANQTLQGADLVRSISLHSTLRYMLKNSH